MSADTPRASHLLVVSNMWPSPASPVFGGFVARNVEALCDAGATVDVVANEDPRTGVLPSVRKYARLAARVRTEASGKHYDAVVGHYLYPTAAMAHTAARIAGSKLVLVVHGTDSRSIMRSDPWAFAARRGLRAADLVVTVSDALADVIRRDVGVSDHTRFVTIHMGFDDRVFRPDPGARTALGIPEGERVVLFVGNLLRAKGLDLLQEAAGSLVGTGSVDRLVIVGGGPMEDGLRAWASADPALTGAVTMAGRIPQSEVARWMSAADVLVLPSRNEGMGLVLLEAMACGTPCVASRVGGVPEVVDERTGVLVDPEDADALAVGLRQVLEADPRPYREACLAAARGQTARAKAEEMLRAIGSLGDRRPSGGA